VPLAEPTAGGEETWDVLVSTVPAAAQHPHLTDLASRVGVVFEVLYEPWPTPLARAATAGGRALVGGLDLLVHQAVLQVELMTGRQAPLGAMRAAGEAALAARSR
jgi:shikimate dehydrogenase